MARHESNRVQRPLGDDEVLLWAEPGGPIMLKAIDGNDPVELTESRAAAIATILMDLVARIRADDET